MSWECDQCGTMNEDTSDTCRFCKKKKNAPLPNFENNNTKKSGKSLYIILFLAFILLMGFLIYEDSPKSSDIKDIAYQIKDEINEYIDGSPKKNDSCIGDLRSGEDIKKLMPVKGTSPLDRLPNWRSLRKIQIGDTPEAARLVAGKEKEIRNIDGLEYYYFDQVIAVMDGRIVVALISDGPDAEYFGRIREGNTMDEVYRVYPKDKGQSYADENYIYQEYTINMAKGVDGILRVAFGKGSQRVKYISIWAKEKSVF